MKKEHQYALQVEWTGNTGQGTCFYSAYERSYRVSAENKPVIQGSADRAFRGDEKKYNPEEMLVCSLSACHMLWYLHLCAEAGIIVTGYTDHAKGVMQEDEDGSGRFTEVTLNPVVTVAEDSMIAEANGLHEKAHELCFIAKSVNFPVFHKATVQIIK